MRKEHYLPTGGAKNIWQSQLGTELSTLKSGRYSVPLVGLA